MKKAKKVNYKDLAKKELKDQLKIFFASIGDVEDGRDFGFTKDTLVLHSEKCDIQIKLIVPKSGIDRYEKDMEEE